MVNLWRRLWQNKYAHPIDSNDYSRLRFGPFLLRYKLLNKFQMLARSRFPLNDRSSELVGVFDVQRLKIVLKILFVAL